MTNRRSFLKTLLAGTAAFSILPSATTYARSKWVKHDTIYVINPEWIEAKFEMVFLNNMDILELNSNEPRPLNAIREPFPMRFNYNSNGEREFVTPFIAQ